MADLATLKIAVDSRPVDQASNDLDELASSASRAEKAAAGLTNQTKATGAAMAGMNNAVRQAKAAQEAAAQAMGGVAGRSKLASHEITNLAFQFQDLGVQIAGGANPLTAFIQQGSQISGIMMQSGMGVAGFTKAVVAMIASTAKAVLLNPIFLGIAATIGTVSAAVNFMADDISKASGVTVTASDVMLGAFDVIRDGIKNQVISAFQAMGIDTGEVWNKVVEYTRKAVNIIIGLGTFTPRAFITAFQVLPAALADIFISGSNKAISVINGLVVKAINLINGFSSQANIILDRVGLGIGMLDAPRISAIENSYAGAAAKAANAFVKVGTGTINRDFIGKIGSVIRNAAVNRATQRQAEESGKQIGKTIGRSAGKTAAEETVETYREMVYRLFGDLKVELPEASTEAILESIKKAKDGADELAGALDIIAKQDMEKLNEQLRETVSLLSSAFGVDFGGIGKSIGKAFPELGRDLKVIFKSLPQDMQDVFSGFLQDLPGILATAFAGAQIGGMVGGGGTGSKIGGALGGMLGKELGNKFLGPALGKMFSGALGKALGSLGGPIGMLAGSLLGGVVGGLFKKSKEPKGIYTIQQITSQGFSGIITSNSEELKSLARSMALGVFKSLESVAEAFGGQIGGQVGVSLGQYGKGFVVDPTGKKRVKGAGVVNFGEDQAAAIAYATQVAIQQGVITGLRAGTETLIKSGKDLQAQLQKAMQFEQVFKDLRAETDPLGLALDELAKEFEKLRAIFREAGASAADYAALEELYARRRAKATLEAERPRRELEIELMEATGNAAGALAAQRALELEAMDASLRGLQQQVWAAQDAAAAQLAASQAQAEADAAVAQAREQAAQAVKNAEEALRQAYRREASVFEDTIERFTDLGKTLREFAASILPLTGTGSGSLEQLNNRFRQTLALARLGNAEAMAELPGVGGELRNAIMDNATDRVSMLRRLSELKVETESVAEVADRQVAVAKQQLEALQAQVGKLTTLDESVLTVGQAIADLQVAQQTQMEVQNGIFRGGFASVAAAIANAAAAQQAANQAAAKATQEAEATKKTLSPAQTEELFQKQQATGFGNSTVAWYMRDAVVTAQELAGLKDIFGSSAAAGKAVILDTINQFDPTGSTAAMVRGFVDGGFHSGGLRIVGENGPELEATGPSRIYNANQLGNALAGTSGTAEEIKALRDELKLAMYQIAKNTGKSYDLLNRWDGDGLPETRDVA